jgi:DNA polymerase (family 10)
VAAAKQLTNAEIADRLELLSALLELDEANPFATRAYRRAAESVRSLPASVADLVRSGRIRDLRGIGPGIEAKLIELVETGEIAELRDLERQLEPELVAFGRLLGLTSRRTLAISQALGVRDAGELRRAIDEGRLREAPGVGPVTDARLRALLEQPPRAARGLTLDRSLRLSRAIADAVGGLVAGPARRFAELAYEIVIVSAATDPGPTLDRFADTPAVVAVLERGARHAVGVTLEGVPLTLVVAEASRVGTELVRATGSPEYVTTLEPLPDGSNEQAVFAALGIPFCLPELRELDASTPAMPLVALEDLRGDLHCHTTWSDGGATVLEMARAARDRGYEYLAVCDHTPNVGVVPGLDADELRRQGEEIAAANERLAPFRVLRGVECDIRADGTLDAAADVLAELDWVQLSLHAGQRRPGTELTRIVTEAMADPHVRALSHPTGRLLNRRPENGLHLHEVFSAAIEHGVALEVNGLPDRLDLSSLHVKEALSAGVELVLNSDAHSVRGLGSIELALATARRGGAPAAAVVNSRPAEQVLSRH